MQRPQRVAAYRLAPAGCPNPERGLGSRTSNINQANTLETLHTGNHMRALSQVWVPFLREFYYVKTKQNKTGY